MSGMKKAIGGSIHRIREFELEKVNLIDEFDILQIVGEGWFGKILLTEHRSTQTEMVLKALPKAYTGISDFFREFHYGLHLAAHRNIITTYDVAFETAGFYVFSQEYAPLGDLTSNVTETGLGELHAKRVARQLAAAVHHIHSRELVHRDIKLDNILVFRSDFSRIKLCDFGETRRINTVVRRHNEWLPYSPPEVLKIDTDVTYKARTSHDVWQFGIVLFVCLTGCLPWQKAALDDPRYTRYQNWHNATLNIAKKPKLFQLISSRAQRMFKRLLDPKAEKRPVSVLEVNKYLEDRWLAKLGAEKALNGGVDERDELCPSMYSFHSSLEEKNQLLHTLTAYGIETTVDRSRKKDRIREWIQSSAIVEENEGDESDVCEDSEFGEDEDREIDMGNESEEAEPASMRGRHFPEMRPRSDLGKGRRSDRVAPPPPPPPTAQKRKRAPARPLERKIPFAPQVAEERQTIARYASFPNGDPNLAAARNGGGDGGGSRVPATSPSVTSDPQPPPPSTNNLSAGGTPQKSAAPSANGRSVEDAAARVSAESSGDGSSPASSYPATSGVVGYPRVKRSPPANDAGTGATTPTTGPQIPSRKGRAPTTPSVARVESARRTTEVTENEPAPSSSSSSSSPRAPKVPAGSAPPLHAAAATRPETSPVAHRSSTPRSSAAVVPSVVRTAAAVAMTPITSGGAEIRSSSSSGGPVARIENSPPIVAAQSAPPPAALYSATTQNFGAAAAVQGSVAARRTPSSTGSPTSSSSNVNRLGRRFEGMTMTYGKDAYEHYGIAQGAILPMRVNIVRQDSTGSGSRSVSN